MQITVKAFGQMRDYIDNEILLDLKELNANNIRLELSKIFPNAKEVIEHCAFANDERIFSDDEDLSEQMVISIIPPVCGG